MNETMGVIMLARYWLYRICISKLTEQDGLMAVRLGTTVQWGRTSLTNMGAAYWVDGVACMCSLASELSGFRYNRAGKHGDRRINIGLMRRPISKRPVNESLTS